MRIAAGIIIFPVRCGHCVDVCPVGAIYMKEHKDEVLYRIFLRTGGAPHKRTAQAFDKTWTDGAMPYKELRCCKADGIGVMICSMLAHMGRSVTKELR